MTFLSRDRQLFGIEKSSNFLWPFWLHISSTGMTFLNWYRQIVWDWKELKLFVTLWGCVFGRQVQCTNYIWQFMPQMVSTAWLLYSYGPRVTCSFAIQVLYTHTEASISMTANQLMSCWPMTWHWVRNVSYNLGAQQFWDLLYLAHFTGHADHVLKCS